MSKAAKRKLQPTDNVMTTEQLAMKATKDVKQMSPDEKAKLRTRLRPSSDLPMLRRSSKDLRTLPDAALPRNLRCRVTTGTESQFTEARSVHG
jgi:hypothetical protein